MRLQWDRAVSEGKTLYCVDHPQTETTLRCNSCSAPICPRCAVRTPVGFRCKACIRAQQEVFYNAEWYDYPVAALIALVLSTPAAVISGMAGWWFALIISPLAGGLIGSICHWAVRRRRGRWTWLVVAVAMAVGAMGALVAMPRGFLSIGIYLVMGIGAAVGVLRLGKSK
ncbi:MAG: B-box zinc finger protein [Anaerolineae bacterium]|nr:B-box zinc finger protein [Anaerolineae bacterium]